MRPIGSSARATHGLVYATNSSLGPSIDRRKAQQAQAVRAPLALFPSCLCGSLSYLGSAICAHAGGARLSTLETATPAEVDGSRVRALLLRRRFAVLCLAGGDVHDGLAELVCIAGALLVASSPALVVPPSFTNLWRALLDGFVALPVMHGRWQGSRWSSAPSQDAFFQNNLLPVTAPDRFLRMRQPPAESGKHVHIRTTSSQHFFSPPPPPKKKKKKKKKFK